MTIQLDISTLNLQDALDFAVLIEKEAEERYRLFVTLLGERYRGDAADFFAMMARNEQRHGMELAERRHSLFGNTPSRITADMIEESKRRVLANRDLTCLRGMPWKSQWSLKSKPTSFLIKPYRAFMITKCGSFSRNSDTKKPSIRDS